MRMTTVNFLKKEIVLTLNVFQLNVICILKTEEKVVFNFRLLIVLHLIYTYAH